MRHIAGDLVWFEQYVTTAKILPPVGTGQSLHRNGNGAPIYSEIVEGFTIEHMFANLMLRTELRSFAPELHFLRNANNAFDDEEISKKLTFDVKIPLECESLYVYLSSL